MRLGIIPIVPKKNEENNAAYERGANQHPGQRVVVVDPPTDGAPLKTEIPGDTSAVSGTELDLSAASRTAPGDGVFTPPLFRSSRHLEEIVSSKRVCLKHDIVWRSKTNDGFYHERQVGEDFFYDYPVAFNFRAAGEWDHRTPIVHPAVAGLDVTMAGFDEAYMRALSNMEMLLMGRREDYSAWIRAVVGKTIKRMFHPFRLLVRGASLWTVLAVEELDKAQSRSWASVGQRPVPKILANLPAYAAFCKEQLEEGQDILYIRCEDSAELFMVDVLQALASDTFPLSTHKSVAKLWPKLNRPRVAYNAPVSMQEMGVGITANDVYDTMTRYCDLHDCHDLWQQALQLVQGFIARPRGAGVLAGGNVIGIGLPASDLRVGALGPLLAGVTAEGMKTTPILAPDIHMYLYGGAVRGTFLTAAYFEGLKILTDNQPVKLAVGVADYHHFQALSSPRYSRAFVEKHVVPRAAASGWNCITEALKWVVPIITKRNFRHVLDATKVPWWTSVMPHLPAGGGPFLSHWLLPARLNEQPNAGRWYACRILGMTTEDQVAAALRWAGAKMRYIMWHEDGSVKQVMVSDATPDRFLPRVQPVVIMGKNVAQASIQFHGNVTQQYELLKKLGECLPELVYTHENAWDSPIDYLGLDPTLYNGAASVPRATSPDHPPRTPPPAAETEERRYDELPKFDENKAADIAADYAILEPHLISKFDTALLTVETPIRGGTSEWFRGIRQASNSLEMIYPRDLTVEGDLPKQMAKLRAYCHLASRVLNLTAHHNVPGQMTELAKCRGEAIGRLRHLEHAAMRKDQLATHTPSSASSLSERLADTAPGHPDQVHGAMDDPEGEQETPEDFGQATSTPGSSHQPGAAVNVAENTTSEAALGFLPPMLSEEPIAD